jgi:hypothetical protein
MRLVEAVAREWSQRNANEIAQQSKVTKSWESS